MGRPLKDPAERAGCTFSLKLTPAQRAELFRRAGESGRSPSELVRAALFEPPPPPVVPDGAREVGRAIADGLADPRAGGFRQWMRTCGIEGRSLRQALEVLNGRA